MGNVCRRLGGSYTVNKQPPSAEYTGSTRTKRTPAGGLDSLTLTDLAEASIDDTPRDRTQPIVTDNQVNSFFTADDSEEGITFCADATDDEVPKIVVTNPTPVKTGDKNTDNNNEYKGEVNLAYAASTENVDLEFQPTGNGGGNKWSEIVGDEEEDLKGSSGGYRDNSSRSSVADTSNTAGAATALELLVHAAAVSALEDSASDSETKEAPVGSNSVSDKQHSSSSSSSSSSSTSSSSSKKSSTAHAEQHTSTLSEVQVHYSNNMDEISSDDIVLGNLDDQQTLNSTRGFSYDTGVHDEAMADGLEMTWPGQEVIPEPILIGTGQRRDDVMGAVTTNDITGNYNGKPITFLVTNGDNSPPTEHDANIYGQYNGGDVTFILEKQTTSTTGDIGGMYNGMYTRFIIENAPRSNSIIKGMYNGKPTQFVTEKESAIETEGASAVYNQQSTSFRTIEARNVNKDDITGIYNGRQITFQLVDGNHGAQQASVGNGAGLRVIQPETERFDVEPEKGSHELWTEIEMLQQNLYCELCDSTKEKDEIMKAAAELISQLSALLTEMQKREMTSQTDERGERKLIKEESICTDWYDMNAEQIQEELAQLENVYSQAEQNLNTNTINAVQDFRPGDDYSKLEAILDEHKGVQKQLIEKRLSEKQFLERLLDQRLREHRNSSLLRASVGSGQANSVQSSQAFSVSASRDSEHFDRLNLMEKYGELVTRESVALSELHCSSDKSSSDSDSDCSSLDDATASFTYQTAVCRENLTSELKTNLTSIDADMFQALLRNYRIKHDQARVAMKGDRERLYNKLQRRLAEQAYGGGADGAASSHTTTSGSTSNRTSSTSGDTFQGEYTIGSALDSSTMTSARGTFVVNSEYSTTNNQTSPHEGTAQSSMADASTQMTSTLQGIAGASITTQTDPTWEQATRNISDEDRELVSQIDNIIDLHDSDQLAELLRDHFNNVDLLKQRQAILKAERDRELRQRLGEHDAGDTKEEKTVEEDEMLEQCAEELSNLQSSVLEEIRHTPITTNQDVWRILQEYREKQRELVERKRQEKTCINERLQARINEQPQDSDAAEGLLTMGSTHPIIDEEVAAMDNEFYERLSAQNQSCTLSDEQLDSMVEQHLNTVDTFRNRFIRALQKKRQERQEQEKSDLNMAEMATTIVMKQREKKSKLKKLRHNEKQRLDEKLKERLSQNRLYQSDGQTDDSDVPTTEL